MFSVEEFKIYCCRVCGFCYRDDPELASDLPWGPKGDNFDFELCVCCGCEFGYDDYKKSKIRTKRTAWKEGGFSFLIEKFRPVEWNPGEQIKQIPEEFLFENGDFC